MYLECGAEKISHKGYAPTEESFQCVENYIFWHSKERGGFKLIVVHFLWVSSFHCWCILYFPNCSLDRGSTEGGFESFHLISPNGPITPTDHLHSLGRQNIQIFHRKSIKKGEQTHRDGKSVKYSTDEYFSMKNAYFATYCNSHQNSINSQC